MDLRKYTSAEVMMLQSPQLSCGKELMKSAFMDLVFKEILAIERVSKKLHEKARVQTYVYAVRGKNFKEANPALKHQAILLSPFRAEDRRYPIHTVFQAAGRKLLRKKEGKAGAAFKKMVYKDLVRKGYFKSGYWANLFCQYPHNSQSTQMMKRLVARFRELEKELPEQLSATPEKAMSTLRALGSSVLLLNCLSSGEVREKLSGLQGSDFNTSMLYLHYAHQQEGVASDSLAKLDVALDVLDLSLEATWWMGEMGTSVDPSGIFEGIFGIFEGLG